MRKIVKKLELKRETVRTLVMKTGLRTGDLGDAQPDNRHTLSGCIPETSNAISGSSGNRLGASGDTKVIIVPPPIFIPAASNLE